MLQKPSAKSKSRDHLECLKRRLVQWEKGDIEQLLHEGKAIQNQLVKAHKRKSNEDVRLANKFDACMGKGKVRDALRILQPDHGNTGIHDLQTKIGHKTVLEILREKHPQQTPYTNTTIVNTDQEPDTTHPILFEDIEGNLIRKIALNMQGSGGPSGVDAIGWRRYCTSFKSESQELCNVIALMAKRLATSPVDPSAISALIACRLVPLDKKPGVRPIGICEIVRRIISKAIISIVRDKITEVVGTRQLCVGLESGCEAAVHTINKIQNSDDIEAILLVDANNAFNVLNRQAAILNIQKLCPIFATTITNIYRQQANLFVGGEVLKSDEGTTQGDPLAMPMYALATLPLIDKVKSEDITHVWYADDAAAGGNLSNLKKWWSKLTEEGPAFGYQPNCTKSWLIVKPELEVKAREIFKDTGIQVTSDGRPYLGTAIGQKTYREKFTKEKIETWRNELINLSNITKSCPQAGYAALTHGLTNRWTYALRTMEEMKENMEPLEKEIRYRLISNITGKDALTDHDRELLELPVKEGGMGITNPTKMTEVNEHSIRITSPVVESIITNSQDIEKVKETMQDLNKAVKIEKRKDSQNRAETLRQASPQQLERSINLATEKGSSNWLTVLPIKEFGFVLHKAAFRDAIHLRYGWKPDRLPSQCICGVRFDVKHALSCPTGGFPIIRHNEVRDLIASTLTEICHDVALEPIVQPITGETFTRKSTSTESQARLDIRVSGLYGGRFESSFFDIRVFNPHADSNATSSVSMMYRKQEQEKRRKYERRILEVERGSFIPFVASCTGGLGPTATAVTKRIASMIAEKTDTAYAEVINWIRCKISFALIRSSVLCIRGARSKYHKPARDAMWSIERTNIESGLC